LIIWQWLTILDHPVGYTSASQRRAVLDASASICVKCDVQLNIVYTRSSGANWAQSDAAIFIL